MLICEHKLRDTYPEGAGSEAALLGVGDPHWQMAPRLYNVVKLGNEALPERRRHLPAAKSRNNFI